MAELADALDLGSSVIDVGVQVLFPAPFNLSKRKVLILRCIDNENQLQDCIDFKFISILV